MTFVQKHLRRYNPKSPGIGSVLQATSLSDALFYSAYVVWLALMILNTSLFSKYLANGIYAGVRIACLLMLVLKEIVDLRLTQTTMRGFFVAATMAVCGLIAMDTALVDGIVFIACGRNKDFRTIARVSAKTGIATVLAVILSSLMGVITNYAGWSGGRQRSYLGFRYALYPASYAFFITCLVVYLRKARITLRGVAALAACNVVIYVTTTSRVSFILSLLVSIGSFILARRDAVPDGRQKAVSTRAAVACSSSYALAAALSIALALLYSGTNPIMQALDNANALGGRLSISHSAISIYGLHPLGREMHFSGAALGADGAQPIHDTYDYIDNFFVKVAINYGLIFLVLFLVCQARVLWNAYMRRDYYLVLILIAIAIHCLMDNAAINLYYNPFLFLIGGLFAPHVKSTAIVRRTG